MFLFNEGQYRKPNRATDTKNKEYHANFAKFAIASGFNSYHQSFTRNCCLYRQFYAGYNDQWIMDEDLEAFLKDESGGNSGRIKMSFNIIRPIVEQYRGNAINITMNATCQSTSGNSKNRRDMALAEQLFRTEVANQFMSDSLRQSFRDTFDLGQNEEESTGIFENRYVDELKVQMDKLLAYNRDFNEFPKMQKIFAEDMAITGMCVAEGFEHNFELVWEHFDSMLFYFDRTAMKPDLSDAQFQGRLDLVDATTIFERWPHMHPDDKAALEEINSTSTYNYDYSHSYSSSNRKSNGYLTGGSNSGGVKIPQYKTFWRDTESRVYGWVKDKYGYPSLERIGYTKPGETKPEYTEKDTLKPEENPRNRADFFRNGKWEKTVKKDIDVMRYCILIPQEILPTSRNKNGQQRKVADIILEYGVYPYDERDPMRYNSIRYPFKVGIWSYNRGEVISPIQTVINPQRFINRLLSVQEAQINNSGSDGIVIDKSAIEGTNQNEADIQRLVKRGQPITVDTRQMGVQNAVGNYNAGIKSGTYNITELVTNYNAMVQSTTGVNDALQGKSTGSDQLVGVTELQIEKGSVIQQPFYDAITDCFEQMFQHIATVGKMIYLGSDKKIAIVDGDFGAEVLTLSADLWLEEFRCFVKRDNSPDKLKTDANQLLMGFKELLLITDKDFADHWDRSTPDKVTAVMRETQAAKIRLDKQLAEQQKQQEEQLLAIASEEKQEQDAKEQQAIKLDNDNKQADRLSDEKQSLNSASGDVLTEAIK